MKRTEWIKFSSNKPLLLTGFTCYQIIDELDGFLDESSSDDDKDGTSPNVTRNIKVKIIEDFGSSSILKMNARVQMKQNTNIVLSRPILVASETKYKIYIKFSDTFGYYYHSKELKRMVQLDSDTIIKLHSCETTDDDAKVTGVISALKFKQI